LAAQLAIRLKEIESDAADRAKLWSDAGHSSAHACNAAPTRRNATQHTMLHEM
jgi:hypothetical protein